MNRILAVILAVAVVGCGRQSDTFRQGLPQSDMVTLQTPADSTAQGSEGVKQQMSVQGTKSDAYKLTRGATVMVNGATLFVLAVLKEITKHEPTTMDKNQAVWGPYHDPNNDGLAGTPNEWKLTVTRVAANDFSYELSARAFGTQDAFIPVLSGSHTKGAQDNFGRGNFLIDWDNAAQLPQHGDDVGTAEVTYSKFNAQDDVTVDVVFTQVHNRDTPANPNDRVDAAYGYRHTPGAGGTFDFRANQANGDTWNIKSRWLQTGTGRSDVKAFTGGGIVVGTASECWDTNFLSQFQFYSWDASKNYGTVEANCASDFQTAEYSTL